MGEQEERERRAEGFSYWETLGKMENPYRADEKVKLICLI